MKKIFALLLVVLMLVPFVASCKQPVDDTDTNTDTSSTVTPPADDAPLVDEMSSYRGETVNIMAPVWTASAEASYPWSQVELCVSTWGDNTNYGKTINDAVMERAEYIKNTYDITLNWINCGSASMLGKLEAAAANKGQTAEEIIHVALPHVYETMNIVVSKSLYTISDQYIDFEADYYSQESVENHTLSGNRFYAGGDISFMNLHSSFVLFYNNAIAESFASFPDVYEMVREGKWTFDQMYNLAAGVSENLDGNNNEDTDGDKYGLGSTSLERFFQYWGAYQVDKTEDAFGNELFTISLQNAPITAILENVQKVTAKKDAFRTSWQGGIDIAFKEDRLLFYNEVVQKVFSFDNTIKTGMVPFPKLNEQQETYHVPFASQGVMVCVPKATDDRVLSECMIEILSFTASKYVMPAYVETILSHMHPDYIDKTRTVINEQILPNLMYDVGSMYAQYAGYNVGLITDSVQSATVKNGNFTDNLASGSREANPILGNWSMAYNTYTE